MPGFEDYLTDEHKRNLRGHKTFERFLHRAVGPTVVVNVGHHIIFTESAAEDAIPNEIPSADTLWFDPVMMTKVFGDQAPIIMQVLAHREPTLREQVLADQLDSLDLKEKI